MARGGCANDQSDEDGTKVSIQVSGSQGIDNGNNDPNCKDAVHVRLWLARGDSLPQVGRGGHGVQEMAGARCPRGRGRRGCVAAERVPPRALLRLDPEFAAHASGATLLRQSLCLGAHRDRDAAAVGALDCAGVERAALLGQDQLLRVLVAPALLVVLFRLPPGRRVVSSDRVPKPARVVKDRQSAGAKTRKQLSARTAGSSSSSSCSLEAIKYVASSKYPLQLHAFQSR